MDISLEKTIRSHIWEETAQENVFEMTIHISIRCRACGSGAYISIPMKVQESSRSFQDQVISSCALKTLHEYVIRVFPEDCKETKQLGMIRGVMDS